MLDVCPCGLTADLTVLISGVSMKAFEYKTKDGVTKWINLDLVAQVSYERTRSQPNPHLASPKSFHALTVDLAAGKPVIITEEAEIRGFMEKLGMPDPTKG